MTVEHAVVQTGRQERHRNIREISWASPEHGRDVGWHAEQCMNGSGWQKVKKPSLAGHQVRALWGEVKGNLFGDVVMDMRVVTSETVDMIRGRRRSAC